MSDDRLPTDRSDVCALLDAAWREHQRRNNAADADEPDDELLALLATGGIDRLPEAQQAELLRQVATRPWAGRLVKEVADVPDDRTGDADGPNRADDPDPTTPTLKLTITDAARAPRRRGTLFKITSATWAIAACTLLGTGVWRVA